MYDRLFEAIRNQQISDTHEHIISSSTLANSRRGLIEFIGESYLQDDIASVGGSPQLFGPGADEARFKALLPYLEQVQNTTYYRCLIDAFFDLFEMKIRKIDNSNWGDLNERLLTAARMGADWYEKVLHEKARIKYCMLDQDRTTNTEVGLWSEKGLRNVRDNEFEEQFFSRVSRTDLLLNVVIAQAREEIEEIYGFPIKDIDDLDRLTEAFADRAGKLNAVAFKSVAAYFRSLTFQDTPRDEAAKAFKNVVGKIASTEDERKVQDYLIHSLLKIATKRKIPFQFHTGMQAANANTVDHSNPLRLNPLFLQYPEVMFIMLHGGYPNHAAAGVLAKKFPNVMLDFSWLSQMSFGASEMALNEWLDLVPMSKITWGGDCRHVENSYSAILLFRKVLYQILARKVDNGQMDTDLAIEVAENVMYNNAVRIYQLKG